MSELLARWDLDAEALSHLTLDRAIALVNLRRIEVVCFLALLTDLIGFAMGVTMTAVQYSAAAAVLIAVGSRFTLRWQSLRAQQATVIAFFLMALSMRMWATGQFSTHGFVTPGYQTALLTLTMLFVLRPATLATILGSMMIVFAAMVASLPMPGIQRVIGIVNAAIVSGIAQVAGTLIYRARQSDYLQKRLIREQNERLLDHNRELDQLMAITAHDLRSPLYGLRNLLDLTSRRAPNDPDLAYRVMRDGIFSLDAMLALVTRLLEAHTAEHALPISLRSDDVRRQVIAASRRTSPAAQAAGVTVETALPDIPLMARFDDGALAQILDNLLSNAVKFSPRESVVMITGSTKFQHIILSVADEGTGFDARARERMFSKFGSGTSAEKAGTGMGLFIAATLAGRMSASLTFADADPHGSVLTLALPVA